MSIGNDQKECGVQEQEQSQRTREVFLSEEEEYILKEHFCARFIENMLYVLGFAVVLLALMIWFLFAGWLAAMFITMIVLALVLTWMGICLYSTKKNIGRILNCYFGDRGSEKALARKVLKKN